MPLTLSVVFDFGLLRPDRTSKCLGVMPSNSPWRELVVFSFGDGSQGFHVGCVNFQRRVGCVEYIHLEVLTPYD